MDATNSAASELNAKSLSDDFIAGLQSLLSMRRIEARRKNARVDWSVLLSRVAELGQYLKPATTTRRDAPAHPSW
jgi:hypothetical protein